MIRLIFDENLSPSLKYTLRDIYPQSLHVFDIGLDEVDDPAIWEYAKDVGYIIVTKDSDFLELSDRLGHPSQSGPDQVWKLPHIRSGSIAPRGI